MFLDQQAQLTDIDSKLRLVLEQIAVLNDRRFRKSSEKMEPDNQIAFAEVDGTIIFFNEAEAVAAATEYDEDEPVRKRPKKTKGRRAQIIKDLPVIPVEHKMTDEELTAEFVENGWYEMDDEVYSCYKFTPAKVEIGEYHVGVYKSKLVDAYFTWVNENLTKVPAKGKTYEGFTYPLNHEKYLKVFLDDGEVPIDNNAAEQSIRSFCVGKRKWVMIDMIAGAESSTVVYSLAETAKANNLKPYDYFEYLLTEIPKHMDDKDNAF